MLNLLFSNIFKFNTECFKSLQENAYNNSLNNNQSEQEEVITINTQSNENKTNENNAQQANVKTEEEIRQELENKTKQAIEE